MTSTNPPTNPAAPIRQKPMLKKPIIITATIIAIMILAATLIIALAPKPETTTGTAGADATKTADFTDTQKLFMSLCGKEVILDFMEEQYMKNSDKFEVAVLVNRTGRIIPADSNEYISFNIINEEEDSPNTAIDFAYHEPIDDQDTFVIQSGLETYQHFNGTITNEFDNIEDAIRDHLLLR